MSNASNALTPVSKIYPATTPTHITTAVSYTYTLYNASNVLSDTCEQSLPSNYPYPHYRLGFPASSFKLLLSS